MKKLRVLLAMTVVLGAFFSLPSNAQLQYFGYHASGEDDASLDKVKGYTNFSYISTSADIYDTRVPGQVNDMAQRGIKAVIELGKVLWCDYDGSGYYRTLCFDWEQRWINWKNFNTGILGPDKVIGMVVRDEPFNWDVSIAEVDAAAAKVKTDMAVLNPNVKLWLLEAACVVAGEDCGIDGDTGSFDRYTGTLPNIDWIGLNAYFIHPETDPIYQFALSKIKSRFPTKKRIYNIDAWWTSTHQDAFGHINAMGPLAQEYYRMAQSDPGAVAVGVTSWKNLEGGLGSESFPCSVLLEHVAIGRAITGKVRPQTSLPIGSFSIDTNGVASGWACDPDATVCEPPRADLYVDGILNATPTFSTLNTLPQAQCGAGTGYRFTHTLARGTADRSVTLSVQDLSSGAATVSSSCPQNPACVWTPHLQYFGYVGAGDDTQSRGLDETKGFTNFAHIAANADLTGTTRYFVRDRVTAMSQRGIKATIDLGLVLWCGAPSYRNLCTDWTSRWETWKANNASILTSDKVLAFAILDGPFNRRARMDHYEAAAAKVKADFPWAKLWMIEAACVVYGDSCGLNPGSGAFSAYTGSLPNIDWLGLNGYAIHPATDDTYVRARTRLKQRFPGRKWVYVMDGYWDSAHSAAFGSSVNSMRNIAREWHDMARNDFDSIMLGVFLWSPLSGATPSKDFPCFVLSEHREIGREVTGKTRSRTALPTGKLEAIYNGSGTTIGYACDPDGTICENPRIDFYREGTYYTSTVNYPSRSNYVVNAQCGVGVAYRFQHSMNPGASGYRMTAYARDLDSGGVTLPSNCADNPACLWYTTYSEAKGYMEDLGATGIAAGWVCDPDAPHLSTQVKLVANGTLIGTYTANLSSEQAVADECGGGNNHRFSVQLPAWTRGLPVEAYSVDLTGGDVLIPWLCSDPWTDYWSCTW